MSRIRFALGILVAMLPSWLKCPLYRRCYGYRIGRGVRIGFSPLVGVKQCRIGDGARIGHFNLFLRVEELDLGAETRIGLGNLIRGGRRVVVGPYASVLRFNVFNAILDGDVLDPAESTLDVGPGCVVTTGHWLDFSARIEVGGHSILGGRGSSFWTHNRHRTRPITIGHHSYLGSEVRLAPGAEIPPMCVVALGSVLTGQFTESRSLIGGNPAALIRPLEGKDLALVLRKTREDLPDELASEGLPADLREMARAQPGQGQPENQPSAGGRCVG